MKERRGEERRGEERRGEERRGEERRGEERRGEEERERRVSPARIGRELINSIDRPAVSNQFLSRSARLVRTEVVREKRSGLTFTAVAELVRSQSSQN